MADNYDTRITNLEGQVKALQKLMANHPHDGSTTTQLSQGNIIPSIRASGSILMTTAHQTYSLGLINNASQVTVFGNVVHYSSGTYGSGSIDIRVSIHGIALLGKSFFFQPQSSNSVTEGGLPENVVQSSAYFGVNGTEAHTSTDEGHLVDVEWPALGDIVVRATVTKFDNDHIEIFTDNMSAGWGIAANFVVT